MNDEKYPTDIDLIITLFKINVAVATALREQKFELDSQRIDEVDAVRKQKSADAEQEIKKLESSFQQRFVAQQL